jgi:hypothetical protein
MRAELDKWITDIGAEVRFRANSAALNGHSRRIDDLLKLIAEREVATDPLRVSSASDNVRNQT